ncbi:MAG TPA: hypothetical protein VIG35_01645 [Gaiellaceae bacterium]
MASTLDLPRPGKAALPYAALAIAALALDVDPRLPWLAGVAGALLFATAGAARSVRARHELIAVRRTADRLIVHNPISRDASDLVRWRCSELTTRAKRESLRRDIDRVLRSLDPARLPSASPLKRPAARGCTELFTALAARLADERPVAARGILLAQGLLRDAASPLYSDDADTLLAPALRRVTGALEP